MTRTVWFADPDGFPLVLTFDNAPGGPEETLQSALCGTVPFTWIGEAG